MRRRWILNGEEEEETRKITFCDLMEKNGGPEHVESKLIEPTTTTTSIVSCTLYVVGLRRRRNRIFLKASLDRLSSIVAEMYRDKTEIKFTIFQPFPICSFPTPTYLHVVLFRLTLCFFRYYTMSANIVIFCCIAFVAEASHVCWNRCWVIHYCFSDKSQIVGVCSNPYYFQLPIEFQCPLGFSIYPPSDPLIYDCSPPSQWHTHTIIRYDPKELQANHNSFISCRIWKIKLWLQMCGWSR